MYFNLIFVLCTLIQIFYRSENVTGDILYLVSLILTYLPLYTVKLCNRLSYNNTSTRDLITYLSCIRVSFSMVEIFF